ncbi:MAG: MCE family protein [Verrucomicrobia bacterium]|nr:MCE family protein [Verrucomicrobiota bacterium]
MAEYKVQKTGPGVVIFCGVVALIFMVLAAGELHSMLFQDSKTVTIYFDSVSGVKERTKVTYAGRKCGEVVKLVDLSKPKKDPQDPASKSYYVEVTAKVDKKTPVNSKTKALITMVGMLGEKELDLTPGDPEAPALAAGEGLYGESGGIDILINTARKLIVKLAPLLDSVQSVLGNVNDVIKDPAFKEDLKATVARAKDTLANADATLKQAKEMLGENRDNIKSVLINARDLTEKGKDTLTTVNDTFGETRPKLQALIASVQKLTAELQPKIDELMAKSNGAIDKAATTLDKAGTLFDTTNSLLSNNRENISMMMTSLRETGYNAKHFTHTFRMIFAPWSIFSSQKKPDAPKQPEPHAAAKESALATQAAAKPDATK